MLNKLETLRDVKYVYDMMATSAFGFREALTLLFGNLIAHGKGQDEAKRRVREVCKKRFGDHTKKYPSWAA